MIGGHRRSEVLFLSTRVSLCRFAPFLVCKCFIWTVARAVTPSSLFSARVTGPNSVHLRTTLPRPKPLPCRISNSRVNVSLSRLSFRWRQAGLGDLAVYLTNVLSGVAGCRERRGTWCSRAGYLWPGRRWTRSSDAHVGPALAMGGTLEYWWPELTTWQGQAGMHPPPLRPRGRALTQGPRSDPGAASRSSARQNTEFSDSGANERGTRLHSRGAKCTECTSRSPTPATRRVCTQETKCGSQVRLGPAQVRCPQRHDLDSRASVSLAWASGPRGHPQPPCPPPGALLY